MHEPQSVQLCGIRDLSLAKPLAPIMASRRSDIQPVDYCMTFIGNFLAYDFTEARPIPTGLPDWDHEHARPAGAEAPYFLSLEGDAFC